MDLLEKKITGDWIDVREKLSTPVRLKTYLKLDDARLSLLPQELRQASFEGIVEYKRKITSSIFGFLSKLAHMTPSQSEILNCEGEVRLVIYVLCLENLFATGALKPSLEVAQAAAQAGGSATGESKNRTNIDQVLKEVTARLTDNPELAKDTHYKNILMEIQMYKKEYAQFVAMSPKIPDDRAPTFFANFKQRIDQILNNIEQHYQEILIADSADLRKDAIRLEEEVLVSAPLHKLISAQAQELSLVRSTILHALHEGYQIRNLLLHLTQKKEPFHALLDEELRHIDSKQGQGTSGHPLAIKMARNIAQTLDSGNFKKIG